MNSNRLETAKAGGGGFTVRQTNIAKGMALLFLLCHHLFYNSPEIYKMFTSLAIIDGVPVECIIADYCKVCVACFLFLSGYGLFISYNRAISKINSSVKDRLLFNVGYVLKRLIKLLSGYWFIFIIFVPLGLLCSRKFYLIYGSNPFAYLADIFGVSYLVFGYDYTMNGTWWYMSIIIVYYIVFPLVYRIEKISPVMLITLSLILLFAVPDFRELTIWIFPFSMGVCFADKKVFDCIEKFVNKKHIVPLIIVIMLSIVLFAYLRKNFFATKIDGLFATSLIAFSFTVLSRIPILNTVLEKLGKQSASIFMFHSFIVVLYFQKFTYSFKYSLLIFAVSLAICYCVSIALEYIKKIIGWNKAVDFVCKKIDKGPLEVH